MRSAGLNWEDVKAALEALILDGTFGAGAKLPSEPHLCARLETRRHSLRRAIAVLEAEGKILVCQGKGSFIAPAPLINYIISERTRFSENLRANGLASEGETLQSESRAYNPAVARRLRQAEDAPLHRIFTRNAINGLPLSLSQTWVPAALFPDWMARRKTSPSHSALLESYGYGSYRRQDTTIFARPARPEERRLLQLPKTAWVMVSRKLDVAADGTPLLCGESLWAGERIQFTFTEQRIPS